MVGSEFFETIDTCDTPKDFHSNTFHGVSNSLTHSVTTFGDREEGSGNRRKFNNKISADPRLLGALRRMGGGQILYDIHIT